MTPRHMALIAEARRRYPDCHGIGATEVESFTMHGERLIYWYHREIEDGRITTGCIPERRES